MERYYTPQRLSRKAYALYDSSTKVTVVLPQTPTRQYLPVMPNLTVTIFVSRLKEPWLRAPVHYEQTVKKQVFRPNGGQGESMVPSYTRVSVSVSLSFDPADRTRT